MGAAQSSPTAAATARSPIWTKLLRQSVPKDAASFWEPVFETPSLQAQDKWMDAGALREVGQARPQNLSTMVELATAEIERLLGEYDAHRRRGAQGRQPAQPSPPPPPQPQRKRKNETAQYGVLPERRTRLRGLVQMLGTLLPMVAEVGYQRVGGQDDARRLQILWQAESLASTPALATRVATVLLKAICCRNFDTPEGGDGEAGDDPECASLEEMQLLSCRVIVCMSLTAALSEPLFEPPRPSGAWLGQRREPLLLRALLEQVRLIPPLPSGSGVGQRGVVGSATVDSTRARDILLALAAAMVTAEPGAGLDLLSQAVLHLLSALMDAYSPSAVDAGTSRRARAACSGAARSPGCV
eukprot:scaffold4463_cov367-Prasinococcus_capsulatus_cf.AAC.5